ncbi:unnamed protein product [Didymodactylos carnosus]|uniref:ABC transporter domain-containing protein n=1 Tax=Didymodactylos carnosus TaxID=1234261 RepID=A0A815K7I8_9BILA|nr:unnamed protein product [Didymodactylos carnosus]CAF1389184.1 unnamed protein product [Didymodactylos carnosus]CAF4029260.1 unnamed protein product [Didymodactylos carnosus]CAF4283956.1 unnamed protein product [Didymodactylos carnosus]
MSDIVNNGYRSDNEIHIQMNGGDSMDIVSNHDDSLVTTAKIDVLFVNVTKVINVPAKMLDPNSKEKFIQRTLLDRVSGQIHSGEIVALMGPSGSGKTTLLNTLAGRALTGVSGDVYYNGIRYKKSMKRKLAYVLQQDLFFESLTVREQLTYTALLRLPNHLTRAQKKDQVEKVIEQLRIQKCANTPIMLISGGEKKRCNIGTELLTNPSLIFLDEPTSGLDSTSAVALVETLRQLAQQGKTIITSIHQPSSQVFQSFDQLILLADGKTIYMGRPKNSLSYFATLGYHAPAQYNPADYVMDLVNQDMAVREELKQAYVDVKLSKYVRSPSMDGKQYLLEEPTDNDVERSTKNKDGAAALGLTKESKWPINMFAQFLVLYSRANKLTGKNEFTLLNIAQALSLAIVCGLCWLQMPFKESTIPDRASFVFFLMTFWPLQTLMKSLMSFPFERMIINKERASGSFRLSAYFLAKSASEGPLKLVLPTAFLLIAFWMANIHRSFAVFLAFLVFQLLAILVAESIGLFIGATVADIRQGMVLATVSLLSLLLVGGFFVKNLPHWLGVWAKWLSFFKYANDGCLRLGFSGGRRYECVDGTYITGCRNQTTFTGRDALTYLKVDLTIAENFLVLAGMFIFFRILAYISLRFIKDKSGRT